MRRRDGGLEVDSAADMPSWRARAYRRTAILFEGRRYFVAAHRCEGARHHYQLGVWGDDLRDIAGEVVSYDRDFVTARDERLAGLAAARRVRRVLRPLYPLLGLLPGGIKSRLSDRFGVSEDGATVASLYLEGVLTLLAATFFTVRTLATAFGGAFGAANDLGFGGVDVAVVVLAGPDLAMRWSRVFGGSTYPWGFWEWLWRSEPGPGR